jgi:diadenosine tetraphosphatase ApaH/serine/threonine PP2A family protein phosphatase
MRRLFLLLSVVCLLVLFGLVQTVSSDDKPKTRLSKYTTLEVENFDNPRFETKEPMPSDWVPIIREDIVQRVIEKHRFHHVADFHDEKVTDPPAEKTLVLRGKITEFTQGSQAKRYLVGFGAGKGKIVAKCQFVDKDTGEVIWERKVDGRVIGTFQSTEGAIKGLSTEVAKVIDQNW